MSKIEITESDRQAAAQVLIAMDHARHGRALGENLPSVEDVLARALAHARAEGWQAGVEAAARAAACWRCGAPPRQRLLRRLPGHHGTGGGAQRGD